MIDLKEVRERRDEYKASLTKRGIEANLDELLDLDERRRAVIAQVEQARAEQNRANEQISAAEGDDKQAAIAVAKEISTRVKAGEAELAEVEQTLDERLPSLPNFVHPEVPEGHSDEANAVLRQVGEERKLDFDAREHQDLGAQLGVIDVERAAKVSGSRFGYLKGGGAILEWALVRFAIDRAGEEGFTPVIPPVLVRREAMYGTGFFPTDEQQVYRIEEDDLYLAGTSEVPLAAMHTDEILDHQDLPLRYSGFSTCFRREAGTYGKDTKGIIRLHQFDKVEMFSYCSPDASDAEHEKILALEESMFSELEIPYRVVDVCSGELGAPYIRKFDLEAWLPGAGRWLEVTSCSNATDFQARRLKIRVRRESSNELVHTLNGTAVAVQRAIVALLENHQQADGTVQIPQALRPYTGFDALK